MIIFDEKQRIEDLIKNGFQGKTALLDFILLGKYLIYQGYTGADLKNELIKILSDKQELIPASYLPTLIPKIVRVANNSPLQEKKSVKITQKELDMIKQFSDDAQRLAFVYLVCYKFYGKEFSIKAIEAKRFARLTKLRNQQLYLLENELYKAGFLSDKETRTELFYIVNLPKNDDSNVVIVVNDYRDFVLYYEQYLGNKNVKNCKLCGRLIKRNSNSQVYCSDCKKIKDNEKVVRYRNSK